MNAEPISLIECPRDAMQGWQQFIPTKEKIVYINSLLKVGFDTIDFGSFVSPRAIPQMADTEAVIRGLDFTTSRTKLLAIVANERGATQAVSFDAINYLGFPFSISETFQLRNTNSTITQSLERVDQIQDLCLKTKKELVIYLSMGFGNPYGDPYDEGILLQWADQMVKREVRIISLADTVGVATPTQIHFALNALIPAYKEVTFGVHLHSAAENRREKLESAFDSGCRRFDGALKGIGGCPMAQDALVGNMETEFMVRYFEDRGIATGINHAALAESMQIASTIFT